MRKIIDVGWIVLWGLLFLHFSWATLVFYPSGTKHFICEGYALFCLAVCTVTWWVGRD